MITSVGALEGGSRCRRIRNEVRDAREQSEPNKSQVVASDRLERFHRALRVTFNCETTEGLHPLNFLANILSKVIFEKKNQSNDNRSSSFKGREGPVRVTGLALLTTRFEWKEKEKKMKRDALSSDGRPR